MPKWKLNIFVRVVKNRMTQEDKEVEEVLIGYPALTEDEKDEIKNNL